MNNQFSLSILAADKPFYNGQCFSLIVPTVSGQYGIMAHHSNLIAAVVAGTLTFKYIDEQGKQQEEVVAVSQGLVKVENNTVLVLVDSVERPEEIDANRAQRTLEEVKETLIKKIGIREYYEAQTRMARALNRLRVKRNYKK